MPAGSLNRWSGALPGGCVFWLKGGFSRSEKIPLLSRFAAGKESSLALETTFAVPSPSALLVARLKLLSVGSSVLPNTVIYAMSKTMDSNERSNL